MQGSVAAILEKSPVRARQWLLVTAVMLALVIDGLDIQLLSLVAPVILEEWRIDRASFGPALSAALIGMAAGASIGGWLGDRYGRKTVLAGATLFFGAATVAAAFTDSVAAIAAFRFVSGLGFGAVAPSGAALASEWLPTNVRPKVMGVFSVSNPLGGMIGASVVLTLLPLVGWRGAFIVCGVATVLLALAMWATLPESPGFLLRKGRRDQATRLLRRVISPDVLLADSAPGPAAARSESGSVFAPENRRLNAGAWLTFFSVQFIAYAFIAWTPVFLTGSDWPLAQAIRATAVFNLFAVCAALAGGFLLGRFNSRTLLLLCCLGAFASVVLVAGVLAASEGPPPASAQTLVLAGIAGVGASTGIAITAIYTLLSFAYPVSCRSSGMGMGLMMGRAGGIATTLTGGLLLELQEDSSLPFFAVLALAAVTAAAGALILGGHLARTQAAHAPQASA